MAFKEILLHVDDSAQCEGRLDLAIKIARQHGACLTGLYVITHPHYAPQSEAAKRKAREFGALFEQKTQQAGVDSVWQSIDWHVSGVSLSEVVCLHAFYSDLIIIGQPEPGPSASASVSDFAERLVLGSGRPILVLPPAAKLDRFGERVVIAWRAGRESARAAHDAIPFLARADQVRLITVTGESDANGDSAGSCARMCAHLKRHEIAADSRVVQVSAIAVGDLLLNAVNEEGSDLLVLGAYDPASRNVPAIGEVSRHLLRHASVPLFMSH